MTITTKRRQLWLSALALLIFSLVCTTVWLPVAATVGDAYENHKVVHPYTAEQMAEWKRMERTADPWYYGAGASFLASIVLTVFAVNSKRKIPSK